MKNVPENRQPIVVVELIARYKPDILVITGHDGMIKREPSTMIYEITGILLIL